MKLLLLLLFISTSVYAGFTPFGTRDVFSIIPKVSDNISEFSAFVDGDCTITTQIGDIFSDGTKDSTGICTIPMSNLTEVPSCTVTQIINATPVKSPVTEIISISNTSVKVIRGYEDVYLKFGDYPFTITCQKQGADFKMPTVQPVLVPRDKLYNNTTGDVGARVDPTGSLVVEERPDAFGALISLRKDGGGTGAYMAMSASDILTIVGTPLSIDEAGGNGGNVPHACHTIASAQDSSASHTVTCAAGEIVTGGGCYSSESTTTIASSAPSGTNAWTCYQNITIGTALAYAICCDY